MDGRPVRRSSDEYDGEAFGGPALRHLFRTRLTGMSEHLSEHGPLLNHFVTGPSRAFPHALRAAFWPDNPLWALEPGADYLESPCWTAVAGTVWSPAPYFRHSPHRAP